MGVCKLAVLSICQSIENFLMWPLVLKVYGKWGDRVTLQAAADYVKLLLLRFVLICSPISGESFSLQYLVHL